MDLQLLTFPKKSHRKSITLPSNNIYLAELIGILYGDGGIGNSWQVVISLNSIQDAEYSLYIKELFKNLFSLAIASRKRPHQNTLVLVASSTSVVDYLMQKGVVRGNKLASQLDIPSWIKENDEFIKYFIRGIVDTDGCIFHHRHFTKGKYYVNIGFCLTNFSTKLIDSIHEIFNQYEIKSYKTDENRRIYLYSEKAVEKYLSIFGSSNQRIRGKYNTWRDARVV